MPDTNKSGDTSRAPMPTDGLRLPISPVNIEAFHCIMDSALQGSMDEKFLEEHPFIGAIAESLEARKPVNTELGQQWTRDARLPPAP